MSQDLSGYSDEELRLIAAPTGSLMDRFIKSTKEQGGRISESSGRLLAGANRGALGLLTFPATVAAAPYNIYQAATGGEQFNPYQNIAGVLGIKGGEQGDVAGNFGEGLSGGLLGGRAASMVSGLTNLAVKSAFPDSPLTQAAASLALPLGAGYLASRRANVDTSVAPKKGETGVTLTKGQATGKESALVSEQGIARNVAGQPAFKNLADAQYTGTKDYAGNIQSFLGRKDLSATEIRDGVVGEMNKASNSVLNKFRATNRVNFDAAKQTAGDVRLFDTKNVIDTIDKKIALYSDPVMPPELQAVASSLKELRSSFITPGTAAQTIKSSILDASGNPASVTNIPATPDVLKKLTIDELQKHLESFGNAAKTGSYANPGVKTSSFAGATPGTVKGIARDVLRGFKDDLDLANLNGIQGSSELIKARDGFRTGIKEMNDFASRPLVKRLNLESESAITPESVVKGLLNAPTTERKAILELVQQSRPEIYQSLRYRAMQEFLGKSDDSASLLASVNKIKQKSSSERIGNTSDGIPFDDFLFPTVAEKGKFISLTNDLEMIARKASSTDSGKMNAMNPISDVASVAGGSASRYIARSAVDLWRAISAPNIEKASIMMTSPDAANALRQLARMKAGAAVPKSLADRLYPLTKLERDVAAGGVGSAIVSREVAPSRLPIDDYSDYSTEELEKFIKSQQQ